MIKRNHQTSLLLSVMYQSWSKTTSINPITYLSFVVRTIWTIVMLLGFILVIAAGHFYVALIVLLLNIGIFKEIISLKRNYEKENKIPLFSFINWYFFTVGVFFFYGKLFSSKLSRVVWDPANQFGYFIVSYHNILSFMLWIVGFLIFVLSLK